MIVLPKPPGSHKNAFLSTLERVGFIFTSKDGHSCSLYLVNTGAAAAYDLPPLPPLECFDIRFASDRFIENAHASSFEVVTQGARFPLSVAPLNIENDQFEVAGVSSGINYGVLSRKNSVLITDTADVRIRMTRLSLADRYSLSKNYPNPFGPSTRIEFGLPCDSKVKVEVFTVLGQKVNVLFDGVASVGVQHYDLDDSAMATGVYFYRFETTSISNWRLRFAESRVSAVQLRPCPLILASFDLQGWQLLTVLLTPLPRLFEVRVRPGASLRTASSEAGDQGDTHNDSPLTVGPRKYIDDHKLSLSVPAHPSPAS